MKAAFYKTCILFCLVCAISPALVFGQTNTGSGESTNGFRAHKTETASPQYSWSAIASCGPLLYYGDMRAFKLWTASAPISELRIGYGLALSHQFVPAFGIQTNFLTGNISGQKRFHDKSISSGNDWYEGNPLYLKGGITEFSLSANLNLVPLFAHSATPQKFDVIAYAGIGVVSFHSKDYYMFTNELENTASGSALSVPYGLKVNYIINPNWKIGIDLGNRLTNTDNLDAWSEKGSKNDGYGFYALSLSYSFGPAMNARNSHNTAKKHFSEKENAQAAARMRKINEEKAVQQKRDDDAKAEQQRKDDDAKAEQLKNEQQVAAEQNEKAKGDSANKAKVQQPENTETAPLSLKDKKFVENFTIQFDYNQATIRAPYFERIDRLAKIMNENNGYKLLITGYADNKGAEANNIIIGQKRADDIKDYLVKKGVANPERITTVSMGSKKPLVSNKTAAGRAKNRRITFDITQR